MVATSSTTTTAETIAKQHGVSERTIRSDGKKAEAIERLKAINPGKAVRFD